MEISTAPPPAPLYRYKEFYIPHRMMGDIDKYVQYGTYPGDFLQRVISNDLMGAIEFADSENLNNLPAYIHYFKKQTPDACFGSHGQMNRWNGLGGIVGLEKKPA